MAAVLCRKGSPVVEGRSAPVGWAAAIICALGWINFLSDPGLPPVRTQSDIAAAFGVSTGSMQAKSRQLRDGLDFVQFHPAWALPSLMKNNPPVWMFETPSGIIIDVRALPRHEQAKAFEAGFIPYIPADLAQSQSDGGSSQESPGRKPS